MLFITKLRALFIFHKYSLVRDGGFVEVVDEFELIGITIYHNLLFNKYVE